MDQDDPAAHIKAPDDNRVSAASELQNSRIDPVFSIRQLAQEFGISTRTMRFYEARGLLKPRRAGTNRIYSKRDRARLILILRGKNLGFSLDDIAEYLALYDVDTRQQAQTEMLLERIEKTMTDLEKKRADLDRTLEDLKDLRSHCQSHLSGLDNDNS